MKRQRADKVPKAKLISELKRVAALLGREFTQNEFLKHTDACKSKVTVRRTFGSWKNALKEAGIENLNPAPDAGVFIPSQELFAEMERIWRQCGHRPSKDEWAAAKPKYSYGTYRRRFGGWIAACEKFLEFQTEEPPISPSNQPESVRAHVALGKESVRTIPLGIRLKVLERDGFRCRFCGRSPATEPRIRLHIDHMVPFAKGGKTEIGNLQTLCNECNWGKGAKDVLA